MTEEDHLRECTVMLAPSGREFIQSPTLSLLEAGLSAGIPLPYRCSNGSCGECRARVLQGTVKKHRFHDFVLPAADQLRGDCLLCSTTAIENVVIEVAEATRVEDIAQQSLQAKLCHTADAQEVTILQFKFTRGKALRFLPGQYVQLDVAGDASVTLPISSCPCEPSTVEFHINSSGHPNSAANFSGDTRATSDDEAIKQLLAVERRSRINVTGPFGGVSITDPPTTPQLFLAVGIEFRGLQGLIEHLFNLDTESPIGLVWLSNSDNSHYRSNLCRSWNDAIDNFSFYPVHSIEELLSMAKSGAFQPFESGTTIYQVNSNSTLSTTLIESGLNPVQIHSLAELAEQFPEQG